MLKLNFGHPIQRTDSLEKILMLGKIEGRRRRGRQYEIVAWYRQLNGHESEQTLEEGNEGQQAVCCSPLGSRESDMTERLNNSKLNKL